MNDIHGITLFVGVSGGGGLIANLTHSYIKQGRSQKFDFLGGGIIFLGGIKRQYSCSIAVLTS